MSAASSVTLSFKLHYAATSYTPNTDRLTVQVSNDCGKSWFQLYTKAGNTLKTISTNISSSYTPAPGSNEWRTENIMIDDSYLSSNWYFKFVFTNNGGGNNIFIDNVNINGISTIGIKENIVNTNFIQLVPNPANEAVLMQFKNEQNRTVNVYNQLGQLQHTYQVTKKEESITTQNWLNGVYYFSVEENGFNPIYKKVVVNH
jgi:hypothetical protein